MGLLDWLFKQPAYYRHEDSFTLERQHLWEAIRSAFERCQEKGQITLAICHFASTFASLQDRLMEWNLPYEIVQRPIDQHWFTQLKPEQSRTVSMVLAPLLGQLVPRKPGADSHHQLAMIVCERHPLLRHDQAIEAFARKAPVVTQLGYFMALDDPVIENTISPQSIGLLKQLGLSSQELITSHMVTRRLNKVLKRRAIMGTTDHPADSPEEWYEINARQE